MPILILIDRANVGAIKKTLKYLPIDDVTTNPSILCREGKEPLGVLHGICAVPPTISQLHVQIMSETAETMVDEARALRSRLDGNLFVKLPVAREDFRAILLIIAEGIQVTATSIHSSMQSFMATEADARYVAPYINHMDDYGIDDVHVTTEIHKTLRSYGLGVDVLAASFKSSEQVLELIRQGVDAIATAPDVPEASVKDPAADAAIAEQNRHFDILVGNKKSWKDLADEK